MSQNKSVEGPSEWVKDYVAQKSFVNDYLRNTYGLDDDSLLNAGEVEELCEMIVYETLKKERQTSQEREREIVEATVKAIRGDKNENAEDGSEWANGYNAGKFISVNCIREIAQKYNITLTNPNKD